MVGPVQEGSSITMVSDSTTVGLASVSIVGSLEVFSRLEPKHKMLGPEHVSSSIITGLTYCSVGVVTVVCSLLELELVRSPLLKRIRVFKNCLASVFLRNEN